MKQIYPDLWQTAPEQPVAEAPSLVTHAFLLTREDGNVLFYSSGHTAEHRRIAELGGLRRQYLSHQDEVGPALAEIKEKFGSELVSHGAEKQEVGKAVAPDRTFDARETHLGNIEIIPTPGHTRGSTCYLVRSPHGKTYLFTGDTLFMDSNGRWQAGLLPFSDAAKLRSSLELLRTLTPDVVISSAAPDGKHPVNEVTPQDWRAAVGDALEGMQEKVSA
ncbi:MBL fold metallo-hydrolase [uncultured Parvibaculum sp.]|uniref:MBL fold metallo-hydrolase n=1 Tax=uncultured Parvibaculum sp. TaxID=291828 RepID=UPI0030EC1618